MVDGPTHDFLRLGLSKNISSHNSMQKKDIVLQKFQDNYKHDGKTQLRMETRLATLHTQRFCSVGSVHAVRPLGHAENGSEKL